MANQESLFQFRYRTLRDAVCDTQAGGFAPRANRELDAEPCVSADCDHKGKEARRSANCPGRDTTEVTVMPDKRTTAESLSLATDALVRALRMINVYDADPDANAGDLVEDLRALCADHLLHLGVEVDDRHERGDACDTL